MDADVRRARDELRREVGDLATPIAERLVRRSLRDEDHQRIVAEALARGRQLGEGLGRPSRRRYAKALLELASERNQAEAVARRARRRSTSCSARERRAARVLRAPWVASAAKRAAAGRDREPARGVARSRGTSSRWCAAPGRSTIWRDPRRLPRARRRGRPAASGARVRSAAPLTEAERSALASRLGRAVGGKTVLLEEVADRELLGGFVAEVGSWLVDGSWTVSWRGCESESSRGAGRRTAMIKAGEISEIIRRQIGGLRGARSISQRSAASSRSATASRACTGSRRRWPGELLAFPQRRRRHGAEPRGGQRRRRAPRRRHAHQGGRHRQADRPHRAGAGRRGARRARGQRPRPADRRQGPDQRQGVPARSSATRRASSTAAR